MDWKEGPPLPVGLDPYLPWHGHWPWYKAPVTTATLLSIAVTPASASIAAGSSQQYKAVGSYSDGSTQNITSTVEWDSSDSSIAAISSSGLAIGLAEGDINITASLSGVTSLAVDLTVTSSPASGPGSFTVKVVNLPAGATVWNCAMKDPSTGIYYQPDKSSGSVFGASDSAVFNNVPSLSGMLTIQSLSTPPSLEAGVPILTDNAVNINAVNGRTYIYNFLTNTIS
jgi:hypothetical protein